MTTIAYRDGVLAADTLVTCNGTRTSFINKMFRVKGWMIAGSGSLGTCFPVARWIEEHDGNVCFPIDWGKTDDSGALLVSPAGLVFTADTGSNAVMRVDGPYQARGTGMDFALAAMALGSDARLAVEISLKHDVYSGGCINWMRLNGDEDLSLPTMF